MGLKQCSALLLVCFLLCFVGATLAESATVCVTPTGSGSMNGADWSNAMQWPPTFSRGNTYYLAGGSYGSGVFSTPVSGSTFITIKKATASDHVTDTGWQASYGTSVALFTNISFSTSYWIFDGVTGGGPGSWGTGHGFEVTALSDLIVLNGSIGNITVRHVNAHVFPENAPHDSMGDPNTGTNFFEIFKGTAGGIGNITVQYCYFHNVFGCPFQMVGWDTVTIEYNYLRQNRGSAAWHSAGIAVHPTTTNVTVRYNVWEDIEGTSFIDGIEYGEIGHWYVYGNVFAHTGNYGSSVSGVITTANDATNRVTNNHWGVYNNSIINVKGVAKLYWADPAGTDIIVENNLFYGNRTNDSYTNYVFIQGAGVTYDYNHYSATAHPGFFTPGAHENSLYWGPNCLLSADTTNYFVNWQNGDYRLNQALAGIALPSPYGQDILGNTRGADGTWDVGAYEYGPGNGLAAPSNLRIAN